MRRENLRAARANHVFCTDKKHPYRKHGYDEKQGQRGFLYKIGDYVRMCFSSARNRRSARTVSRPRNIVTATTGCTI
jgi:hypothetical protein